MDKFIPTKEQLAVINEDESAYVHACPGAGKTQTMVALAARAARDFGPRRGVAFLSFTNAACDELNERLAKAGVPNLSKAPSYVGTFDSFLIRFVVGPDGTKWAPGKRARFLERWSALEEQSTFMFHTAAGGRVPIPLDVFGPDAAGRLQMKERRGRDVARLRRRPPRRQSTRLK